MAFKQYDLKQSHSQQNNHQRNYDRLSILKIALLPPYSEGLISKVIQI